LPEILLFQKEDIACRGRKYLRPSSLSLLGKEPFRKGKEGKAKCSDYCKEEQLAAGPLEQKQLTHNNGEGRELFSASRGRSRSKKGRRRQERYAILPPERISAKRLAEGKKEKIDDVLPVVPHEERGPVFKGKKATKRRREASFFSSSSPRSFFLEERKRPRERGEKGLPLPVKKDALSLIRGEPHEGGGRFPPAAPICLYGEEKA